MNMYPAIPVYAILSTMKGDYDGGFKKMGDIGYRYIELLGINPFEGKTMPEICPAGKMREILAESRLTPISYHEQVQDFKNKKWDKLLSYCDAIGCRTIVLPSMWIRTEDEALALAENLDQVGRFMAQRGFVYCIHTHHLEFRRLSDGRTLVDVLLENTDPENVEVEFDIVWSMRGGVKPLEELKKFGTRCSMVHMKDFKKDFDDPINLFELMQRDGCMDSDNLKGIIDKYSRSKEFFCTIGTGGLDIPGILKDLKQMGYVKYVIAENEEKTDHQYDIAKQEYDYLSQWLQQEA